MLVAIFVRVPDTNWTYPSTFSLVNAGNGFLLTLSPLITMVSAKLPACFNFQSASMLLKIGEDAVCLSNSLDPGEVPSYMYSASHPDPSCLHMTLYLGVAGYGLKSKSPNELS